VPAPETDPPGGRSPECFLSSPTPMVRTRARSLSRRRPVRRRRYRPVPPRGSPGRSRAWRCRRPSIPPLFARRRRRLDETRRFQHRGLGVVPANVALVLMESVVSLSPWVHGYGHGMVGFCASADLTPKTASAVVPDLQPPFASSVSGPSRMADLRHAPFAKPPRHNASVLDKLLTSVNKTPPQHAATV